MFYIREQDKVAFTTRLTSLILQQYKIGFKVELRNNKVIVVISGTKIAYEDVFSISRKANGANNESANSKTVMPTATTQRLTLSFCIVSFLLELFDSLDLQD